MATTTIPCRKVYKFRMEPAGLEALELELGKSLVKTKPAKSWMDAILGELLRQVEYKARWSSKHFVPVGRFFPSTKLCSGCGYKNDSLSLSDREWTCPACATHHIRDFNSAKNVKSEGLKIVAAGYRRR
jgi:putative transposase